MKPKKGEAPQQSENPPQENVSAKQLPHGVEGSLAVLKSKPVVSDQLSVVSDQAEDAELAKERRLMAERFADTLTRELAKRQAEEERTIEV